MSENINAYRRTLVLIVGCILAAAAGIYYGVRLGMAYGPRGERDRGAVISGIFLFLLLVQLLSGYSKGKKYTALYRVLIWLSGLAVSMLIYGMMLMILMDIAVLIITHVSDIRIAYGSCARISLYLAAVITLAGVLHAKKIRTVHYDLATEKFSGSYRIVQLSDLHIGSVVGAGQMRRAVEKTNALHPDLVVITGDLVNHGSAKECAQLRKVEEALSGLAAPDGVYAITGNHDPKPDDPAFMELLEKSGICLLNNRGVQLDRVYVYGRNGNSLSGRVPLEKYFDPERRNTYSVVLDHYPDGSGEAEEAGADLFLAGHTHGGQYFPCTLIVRKVYRGAMRHGYSRHGKTDCVISSGTGYFQIPIRIATDSEVVCIDIRGTADNAQSME